MALSVQTNSAATTALKHLNNNNKDMGTAMERLSSGYRINSAADDAAGYAISSKLGAQGSRLQAASQNAMQASAMVKMADAAVQEIENMVVRIQTLAIQASSSNNATEIGSLSLEKIALETQITNIATATNYNGTFLLNGSAGATGSVATAAGVSATATISGAAPTSASHAYTLENTLTAGSNALILKDTIAGTQQTVTVATPAAGTVTTVNFGDMGISVDISEAIATFTAVAVTVTAGTNSFQVGSENTAANKVTVDLSTDYSATGLGLDGVAWTDAASANTYIATATTALGNITDARAKLGATQNQLSYVNSNLATQIEQIDAAVSIIKDADMASEMAAFTKSQILVQAGTSMLAQANSASQNVMSLFR